MDIEKSINIVGKYYEYYRAPRYTDVHYDGEGYIDRALESFKLSVTLGRDSEMSHYSVSLTDSSDDATMEIYRFLRDKELHAMSKGVVYLLNYLYQRELPYIVPEGVSENFDNRINLREVIRDCYVSLKESHDMTVGDGRVETVYPTVCSVLYQINSVCEHRGVNLGGFCNTVMSNSFPTIGGAKL